MKIFNVVLALVVAGGAVAAAQADQYPAKTVRIITGSPGNLHDVVSRHFATLLSARWGQPVVVENRAGAGLTIGTAQAVLSPPDGYTLLMTDRTAVAAAPSLIRNLSYDPARDLAPITLVATAPMILVGHESLPARNLHGFIEYVRQQPQAVHFVSAGPATVPHIANEVFKQLVGVEVISVQYKGSPLAMMGLLAGEARAGFMLVPVVLPHLKAGRVKGYAITSLKRFSGAPDVPTVGELGMPELESQYWIAMMAPARTPAPIIQKINRDIVDILSSATMRDKLLALGAEPAPGTPNELAEFIRSETVKWRKVIEVAGMRLD